MSVCEFIERNGAELLVYRLISIIIATRVWNEIHDFGNDFYCEHIKFVFKIPEIDEMQGKQTDPDLIKILKRIKTERWKVPEV